MTTLSVGRVGARESYPGANVHLKSMSTVAFSYKAQRVSINRLIRTAHHPGFSACSGEESNGTKVSLVLNTGLGEAAVFLIQPAVWHPGNSFPLLSPKASLRKEKREQPYSVSHGGAVGPLVSSLPWPGWT